VLAQELDGQRSNQENSNSHVNTKGHLDCSQGAFCFRRDKRKVPILIAKNRSILEYSRAHKDSVLNLT
jgi:hypothetical protein